jgi:hypothetical protein
MVTRESRGAGEKLLEMADLHDGAPPPENTLGGTYQVSSYTSEASQELAAAGGFVFLVGGVYLPA